MEKGADADDAKATWAAIKSMLESRKTAGSTDPIDASDETPTRAQRHTYTLLSTQAVRYGERTWT